MGERWLTFAEVEEALGLTAGEVRALMESKNLRGRIVDGVVKFGEADVRRLSGGSLAKSADQHFKFLVDEAEEARIEGKAYDGEAFVPPKKPEPLGEDSEIVEPMELTDEQIHNADLLGGRDIITFGREVAERSVAREFSPAELADEEILNPSDVPLPDVPFGPLAERIDAARREEPPAREAAAFVTDSGEIVAPEAEKPAEKPAPALEFVAEEARPMACPVPPIAAEIPAAPAAEPKSEDVAPAATYDVEAPAELPPVTLNLDLAADEETAEVTPAESASAAPLVSPFEPVEFTPSEPTPIDATPPESEPELEPTPIDATSPESESEPDLSALAPEPPAPVVPQPPAETTREATPPAPVAEPAPAEQIEFEVPAMLERESCDEPTPEAVPEPLPEALVAKAIAPEPTPIAPRQEPSQPPAAQEVTPPPLVAKAPEKKPERQPDAVPPALVAAAPVAGDIIDEIEREMAEEESSKERLPRGREHDTISAPKSAKFKEPAPTASGPAAVSHEEAKPVTDEMKKRKPGEQPKKKPDDIEVFDLSDTGGKKAEEETFEILEEEPKEAAPADSKGNSLEDEMAELFGEEAKETPVDQSFAQPQMPKAEEDFDLSVFQKGKQEAVPVEPAAITEETLFEVGQNQPGAAAVSDDLQGVSRIRAVTEERTPASVYLFTAAIILGFAVVAFAGMILWHLTTLE